MRSESDTTRNRSKKPHLVVVKPIDKYAGYCFECGKDRNLSETTLTYDADALPHIVCATCLGELVYVPFYVVLTPTPKHSPSSPR